MYPMQIADYKGKSANNFMGGVIISPNIKRTSERIDPAGNIVNARTKQIIKPVEPEYVPLLAEQVIPLEQAQNNPIKTTSKIDEMINRKIEEIVAKKIEEALSKL